MDLLTSVENQNQEKKTNFKRVLCICVTSSKVRLSSSAALYYTIVGISRLYVQLHFLVSHVRVISLNLSCIRRQRNTPKLCYRDVSSDSTVVTALYPRQPLVYRYVSSDSAGGCIQRQRHTFKLNYRDLSPIEQCTYTVVYVVVSDTSAMSHAPIVMYPPIVIYSNCIPWVCET